MNNQRNQLSIEDAIALLCLCAIQVDEKIKVMELKKLISMISLGPIFSHIKNPVEYLESLNKNYSDNEVEKIMDAAIEMLPSSLRETAYAWAYEMVLADSGVSQAEHTYLNLLVKKMGIHGELAGKIAAVVAILNRKE
ncbi:MAG: tellurite resistance TerB family protein [Oligoflexia bacterium]|nr:tellurite resistance TerB family protein [Oligoflexia bacterium]